MVGSDSDMALYNGVNTVVRISASDSRSFEVKACTKAWCRVFAVDVVTKKAVRSGELQLLLLSFAFTISNIVSAAN